MDCYKKKTIIIALMKDELGEKIMTKCVQLRANTRYLLIDDSNEDEKAKRTKKRVKNLNWRI